MCKNIVLIYGISSCSIFKSLQCKLWGPKIAQMHIQIKICEYQDDDHHVMLYYNRTAKDCQSLHCKPKASPCRCSIYGTPLFIWSYGFTVAQTVAQSMLQPHNQCCSAENRSHMAPHPCCAAAHTHPRPLWGELMGDALANTPSDFCDQIIL